MSRPKGSKTKTIESLYEENKDVLFEAGYDKDTFFNNMKSLAKHNPTKTGKPSVANAWKIFKHKEEFVGKEQRGAENLWDAINSQGDLNAVRREIFGWRTSKEEYSKKMKWNDDTNNYEYIDKEGNVWFFELITGTHGSQYWKWSKK